jgi:2-keto-4-pentenoate hydratase/2-oxohepta-3-ene-1,7-dioic acid hydratase in catechol pathway
MKFVTFKQDNAARLGVWLDNDAILDLQKAAPGEQAFASMLALIEAGDAAIAAARSVAHQAESGALKDALLQRGDVTLLAPIPRPRKNVFCVGRNYVDHVNEGYRARGTEAKLPEFPQFFTKPPTAVIGPGATIPHHTGITEKLDYEVELALIIGRAGRDIAPDRAFDHIFGYTILNDVTGRDLQRRHDQWFKGKGLDGSCPMGPAVVLRSAIADAQALDISLRVNGEQRQHSNTRHMIFAIPRIIADLSLGMTLEPGDIIATGTPSGVGYAMEPPNLLKAGDVVSCEIEGLGMLENRVG